MQSAAGNLVQKIDTYIVNPAILVLFALGFFLFTFGLVEFLWHINQGGHTDEGKQHMLWGVVGMFVMASVYGIIMLLANTVGASTGTSTSSAPSQSVSVPSNLFTQ